MKIEEVRRVLVVSSGTMGQQIMHGSADMPPIEYHHGIAVCGLIGRACGLGAELKYP